MTNSYNVQENDKIPIILNLLERKGIQFIQNTE